jgi:DNA-directed RNA polymerase specialized sigma24 family protein
MSDLQETITAALEPLLRRLVREEVERAKLQWRWRSVKQAAELLGLSEHAVHIRCARGQLPCRKLDGRLYIDMLELDRLLLEG